MTRQKATPYLPPDGILNRSAATERSINEQAVISFGEKVGENFLKYLRSITIERVHGPANIDPYTLAYLEGQRSLVAIIEQRIKHGKERKPNVPEATEKST